MSNGRLNDGVSVLRESVPAKAAKKKASKKASKKPAGDRAGAKTSKKEN